MSVIIDLVRDSTLRELVEVQKRNGRYLAALSTGAALEQSAPLLVPVMIDTYGAKEAFRRFVSAMAAQQGDSANLTAVCETFFAAAKDEKVYTSQFYCYNYNISSDGEKLDNNTGLVCEPSTAAVAGRDDYADLALFLPVDVNYTIDAETLEPTITEIDGVTDGFSLSHPNGLVGVMQMTGWVHKYNDGTHKGLHYASSRVNGNYKPLPEAVRAKDNSVRPFVIHAKYLAGMNDAGLLTSASGLIPTTYTDEHTSISHNGQIALWRKLGVQYSGGSICDINFMQMMVELKYATLASAAVLPGCINYNYQYDAAVSESGVERILLTASEAAHYIVGSRVSIGYDDGSGSTTAKDRGRDSMHSCAKHVRLVSMEEVLVDGNTYTALNVDNGGVTFDVEAGTTIVSTMPWHTGTTDGVRGNDGSLADVSSAHYPAKIQGIEFAVGVREVLADTVVLYEGGKAHFEVCRLAGNLVSGGAGTGAVRMAETLMCDETDVGKYVSEAGETLESYILPTERKASTTSGYRANCYLKSASTEGYFEYLATGPLNSGTPGGGLLYALLLHSLDSAHWYIGCRASGTGSNRGEFRS